LENKLSLNWGLIDSARAHAGRIAASVQAFITPYSTVSVERAVCRLLGIEGVSADGVPLVNTVVEELKDNNMLGRGAAHFIGNACVSTGMSTKELSAALLSGELSISAILPGCPEAARRFVSFEAAKAAARIRENRLRRDVMIKSFGYKREPLIYVIVATGNIYEDIVQARACARQGADVIAVIRTTGQSLLDYVPHGVTTEGFGGTYATQENFRLMREALDEVSKEEGRYIRLCNYCSGLCMPEIAALGAIERLDIMLNDALYGILFRDINMKRTLIDQHFSRVINGFAGIIINTGEDNYLTTSDAIEEAHTVLASQFLNEQLALTAGIPEEQMGLGHAFEIDPETENSFLLEFAQALAAREIFPKAKLKYMPPTKHMSGNIFMGQVQNTLFNMISILTGQSIHLLGMMTEAIHTPFMSDRALAIENANYVFRAMRDLGGEISINPGGAIERRAAEVLEKATRLLGEIEEAGLFATLENGLFAGVKRCREGGKGLDGVFEKDEDYMNPFIGLFHGGDQHD